MSAKGGDIRAGAAFVELFVKDAKLHAGLKAAQARLQSFGRSLALIGGFMAATGAAILTPLTAAVMHFAEFGSQLNDMSERTGVAATNLAELGHAAQQTGTDMEAVEKALKFMAKNGMDPNRFDEIADRIAAIKDPALRVQKAIEAWGKTGTMLLPMIANLKALRAEARALGIVFTPDQIKLADELGDAFDRIKTAVKATAFQVGAALAPVLIPILDLIKGLAVWVGTMAREFPVATTVVAALGVALVVLGSALAAVGVVCAVVLPAIAALITIVSTVGIPVALAVVACVALTAVLWAMYAAAAAVIAYFLFFTKTGRDLVDRLLKPLYALLKRFEGMGDVFKKTFAALGDALKAGQMGKAWEILMLGMRAAWHEFAATVLTGVAEIIDAFRNLTKFGIIKIPFADALLEAAADAARAAAKGNKFDAQFRKNDIERIRKTLGQKATVSGSGSSEQSAAAIGFSARAALMGRQVIGGGRDDKMLDAMTKAVLFSAQTVGELKEIKNKIGGKWQ